MKKFKPYPNISTPNVSGFINNKVPRVPLPSLSNKVLKVNKKEAKGSLFHQLLSQNGDILRNITKFLSEYRMRTPSLRNPLLRLRNEEATSKTIRACNYESKNRRQIKGVAWRSELVKGFSNVSVLWDIDNPYFGEEDSVVDRLRVIRCVLLI